MISIKVIQNSIDELRAITRVDLGVFDVEGLKVAATVGRLIFQDIENFAFFTGEQPGSRWTAPSENLDDGEPAYILVAQGPSDGVYDGKNCRKALFRILS